MSQARVAVDIGSQVAKIITVGAPGSPERVRARPVEAGGSRAVLTEVAATGPEVCLAVPDAWLNGSEAGVRRQEALRQIVEEELGLTRVRWAGQLAAVAALAASSTARAVEQAAGNEHGPASKPVPGRYLVCDVGGVGVRVALCEVSTAQDAGFAVRQVGVHAVSGGGWRDFDQAVRTALGAGTDPGLGNWHEQAMSQAKRAQTVFGRAKSAPDFLAARVYALTGSDSDYELTAAQAAECFGPTADRIKGGAAAVLANAGGDGAVVASVLTGGLAWFPLAAAVLTESAGGRVPLILGPEAAARGALLLADDLAGLGACRLPPASVPMHEVKDGLLTEVSVPLSWTASFGETDDPLYFDAAELTLDIGARRVTVPLPELTAGTYRAAVRPSWAGGGALVLRAAGPSRAATWSASEAGPAVRIVPLAPYIEEVTS